MKSFFLIGGIVLMGAWVVMLLKVTTNPLVHILLAAGIISVGVNIVLQQKKTEYIGKKEEERGTADPHAKPANRNIESDKVESRH